MRNFLCRIILSLFLLFSCSILPISYADKADSGPYWHGFKGDSGHTGFSDIKMDKKLALQWRYFYRGDYINPIQLYGENLYFLDRSGFLYSIQTKDSKENYKIAISENRMVFGIDIDNKYIFVTTGPVYSRRGISDMSCYLTALKRENGEKAWSVKYDSIVSSPPVIWNGRVYCSIGKVDPSFSKTTGGNVYGYDEDTGKEQLNFEIEEYAFIGDYLSIAENVIIGQTMKFDRRTRTQAAPKMIAINATTGRQFWVEEPSEEGRTFGMPAIKNSFVYVMENPRGGGQGGGRRRNPEAWLLKIDLVTGKIVKNMNIQNENFGYFSPTLAQDAIYINSFTGKIYCIDYEMEKIYWIKSYDRFSYFTELTATRNYLYTCLYSGEFLCISKEDGSIHYRYRVGNYGGIPVVSGDEVYVSGESLYCFSLHAVPMLLTEPSNLDFDSIKKGESVQKSFRVLYTGIEKLEGKLSSSVPWISIKPLNLSGNIQTCFASVDSSLLEAGIQEGSIVVETNFGTKTIPVKVKVIVPPPLPLSINIKENQITNQKQFILIGQTDPQIQVFINSFEIFSDNQGRFFQNISLHEGLNTISVEAISKDGRKASNSGTILMDSIPPMLEAFLDRNPENSLEYIIKGKTEPGVLIHIGEQDYSPNAEGLFVIQYQAMEDQKEVSLVAVDEAGNKTEIVLSIENPE